MNRDLIIEPNIKPNIEPNIVPNNEPNIEPNIELNMQPNILHRAAIFVSMRNLLKFYFKYFKCVSRLMQRYITGVSSFKDIKVARGIPTDFHMEAPFPPLPPYHSVICNKIWNCSIRKKFV